MSIFYSFLIQHIPDGFIVTFDSSDVDETLLLQKKSSDSSEWQDINKDMEVIEIYKRFELRGEESNNFIDIRLITTRISQNDDQPYIIFTAIRQKMHSE